MSERNNIAFFDRIPFILENTRGKQFVNNEGKC